MSREHIICVDDEEGILTALRQQLGKRFGDQCEISIAQSGPDALELIDELQAAREEVAVIIADQIMPGMKGVELLEEVGRRSPHTAKILLTGQAGLDSVVEAINRAGLDRYISKPWEEPDLRLAVESLLRMHRLDRQNAELLEHLRSKNAELEALNRELDAKVRERTVELERLNERLAQLAVTDGLTALHNHRYLREHLVVEVQRSLRTGAPLSLLMIDVDHFKAYNDRHGHPEGDLVLREIAHLLVAGRRSVDLVARYGGEEFTVVLVGGDKASAAQVGERLRHRVAEHHFPHAAAQPGGHLSISIGVAACPTDARSADGLLRAADAALYRAKKGGRDRVELASPLDAESETH